MPHLMVMVLGMMLLMSLLTYIIPAGQFALDPESGTLDGNAFTYLETQTPVSPWRAMNLILKGVANSGTVIGVLFAAGGATSIVLKTKAIDKMIDLAIYKLQDKGVDVLVPLLTLVFLLFGTFSGGDFIVALVPIGLMIARKLHLDPIMGFAIVICSIMLAGTSSPTKVMLTQMMMGVPVYSGFGLRMLLLLPIYLIIILYLWRYARRVAKDPANSVLGLGDWCRFEEADEVIGIHTVTFDPQAAVVTLLYIAGPVATILFTTKLGYGQEVIPTIWIIDSFLMGLVYHWSADDICKTFAQGVASMAFVGFIIGMANAMSLVMTQGNILHTIVYTLCIPLRSLSTGAAAVGIFLVVTLINLLLPSESAKVALLCPIITPMCQALSIPLQVGVSAFKSGDALTNIIGPVHGVVLGGLETAKVPFSKYVRWALPMVLIIMVYVTGYIYFMGITGWTGV